MPIDRETLDAHVASLNERRPRDKPVLVEAFEPPGRFVLSFPNREVGEGECIDQDFTEIQFDLHERAKITTGIQAGRLDEERDRYVMTYEVIEWD